MYFTVCEKGEDLFLTHNKLLRSHPTELSLFFRPLAPGLLVNTPHCSLCSELSCASFDADRDAGMGNLSSYGFGALHGDGSGRVRFGGSGDGSGEWIWLWK